MGTWGWAWDIRASSYIAKVMSYSPIAYWPLNETAGADAICYG